MNPLSGPDHYFLHIGLVQGCGLAKCCRIQGSSWTSPEGFPYYSWVLAFRHSYSIQRQQHSSEGVIHLYKFDHYILIISVELMPEVPLFVFFCANWAAMVRRTKLQA